MTKNNIKNEMKSDESVQVEPTENNEAPLSSVAIDADEELNGGLKVNVRDVMRGKQERKEAFNREKAERDASGGFSLSRLVMRSKDEFDKPIEYHVSFLTPFDKGIEVYVHYWDVDESNPLELKSKRTHQLCGINYGEKVKCNLCGKKGPKGDLFAVPVRCYLGYVYNFVGQTWKKDGKEFKLNPVKLIEVPLNKELKNLVPLQAAKNRGYYEDICVLKAQESSFDTPEFPTKGTIEALYPKSTLEIPEKFVGLRSLTGAPLLKTILGTFTEVDYPALGFKAPLGAK